MSSKVIRCAYRVVISAGLSILADATGVQNAVMPAHVLTYHVYGSPAGCDRPRRGGGRMNDDVPYDVEVASEDGCCGSRW